MSLLDDVITADTPIDTGDDITLDDILRDPNPDEPDEKVTADDKSDDKIDKRSTKAKEAEGDEDDELDIKDDDKKDSKKDSKEDDDEDSELELKDTEDELTFYDIPRRREILEKFPELFKKFPGLEHAIYRNKAYSDVFPTVQDAKEAKETAETFSRLASSINSGSLQGLLGEIKNVNPENFKRITATYLQALGSVDPGTYLDTVGHVISNTLAAAMEDGTKLGDSDEGKNLRAAAQIINKYIFRTHEIRASGMNGQNNQPNPREEELNRREYTMAQNQLRSAVDDVGTKSTTTIRNAVEKNIDPKGQMGDYVKSKAIDDTIRLLEKELGSDRRYQTIIDRLWQDSQKNGYNEESRKRIRNAVLAKAKTVLPDIIRKVRGEALKGAAARSRAENDDMKRDSRPVNRGTPASHVSGSSSKLKEEAKNFKGSTLDWLNRGR